MSSTTTTVAKDTKDTKVQHARDRTPMLRGIYVNPSRVATYLNVHNINEAVVKAITELRAAEPHQEPNPANKDETITTPLIPLGKLSQATQDLVRITRAANEQAEREAAEKVAEDLKNGKITQEELDARAAKKAATPAPAAASAAPVAGEEKKTRPTRPVTEHTANIEMLSRLRVRFAKRAHYIVAALADLMAHEQLEFAITNALKHDQRILGMRHVLEPGYENLSLSKLYVDLDVFQRAKAEEITRQRVAQEEAALKKAAAKAKSAAAAAVRNTVPGTKIASARSAPAPQLPTASVVVVPAVPKAPATNGGGGKAPVAFAHYVKQVFHNIVNERLAEVADKENHPYAKVRISESLRNFVSDEIVALIKKLSPLLKGQLRAIGVKTISEQVVEQTLTFMMEVYGIDHAKVNSDIQAKVNTYVAVLREDKEKSPDAADDDEHADPVDTIDPAETAPDTEDA